MNVPHYRPEDQFTEASNAMRLKQLHSARDYNGLLELALILNHEASFHHSNMVYFMNEALTLASPVNANHEKTATQFIEEPRDRS
jgi:hypothetical protein